MFLIKLKYLLHFYKSKFLKKNIKKIYLKKKTILQIKFQIKTFQTNGFLIILKPLVILPNDKNKKIDYLEVGCFEGLSAFYVLSELNFVNAYFLDLWDMPNKNSLSLTDDFSLVEKAFDENLSEFKFTKIKGDSVISMRKLYRKKINFDFIYIDGSHNGEDILSDAIEAFKILKNGGIIYFDDFLQYDKNRLIQSYSGIDKFLDLYSDNLKIIFFQNNLVIKKN